MLSGTCLRILCGRIFFLETLEAVKIVIFYVGKKNITTKQYVRSWKKYKGMCGYLPTSKAVCRFRKQIYSSRSLQKNALSILWKPVLPLLRLIWQIKLFLQAFSGPDLKYVLLEGCVFFRCPKKSVIYLIVLKKLFRKRFVTVT